MNCIYTFCVNKLSIFMHLNFYFIGRASMPGVSQKCATQLCECDREFARCISHYPCPRKKPGCKKPANNYVLLQTITKNEI